MKAIVIIFILSIVIGCSSSHKPSSLSDTELLLTIDSIMDANYPSDEPGAAIIITKEGKEIYKKGFGLASMEFNIAMSPDMIFRLASMTKQFTAVCILMLEEQGKLSISDDIQMHLTDYPTHGSQITIENLLTHTSGIPSFTDFENIDEIESRILTTDEILSLFKDKPLDFEPGEQFYYNNSGYNLLGAIIEMVSGKSYEDFVEQNIFKELGMENSFYDHPEEVVKNKITGYNGDSTGYQLAEYMTMCAPFSAGGLRSNVNDLALWNKALHEGKLTSGERLAKAFTPFKLNSGKLYPYGYGWFTHTFFKHKMYSHNGDIRGFRTSGLYFPEEEIYIAILSNNTSSNPAHISLLLSYEILNVQLGIYDLKQIELEKYAGNYQYNFEVLSDSLGLFLTSPWENRLIPIDKNKFIFDNKHLSCTFQMNSEDIVESMILKNLYRGEEVVFQRINQ